MCPINYDPFGDSRQSFDTRESVSNKPDQPFGDKPIELPPFVVKPKPKFNATTILLIAAGLFLLFNKTKK